MILYSCTNLGSKTFFKSDRIEHFGTLGFCPLQDDSILTKVFANTNEIFEDTIQKSLQNYGILTVHCSDQKVNFNNPDTKLIRTICYEKSIETLLLSKLQFIPFLWQKIMIQKPN